MSINLVSVHRLLSSLEDGTDSTHLNSLNWKRLDNISGINSLENCLQSVLNCPCDPQPLPGLLAGHNFPGLRSNLCHLTRPLTRPRSPDGQILSGNLFSPGPRFRFRFIPPSWYVIRLHWHEHWHYHMLLQTTPVFGINCCVEGTSWNFPFPYMLTQLRLLPRPPETLVTPHMCYETSRALRAVQLYDGAGLLCWQDWYCQPGPQ